MTAMPGEIPERGDLAEISLPRVLLSLHRSKFGGSLELTSSRSQKRFVFQKGAPVVAESNLKSETLGVQLVDKGLLDRDAHERVQLYMEQKGCREGVALLALKLLQPKDLFVALKDQVRRRMVESFGWPGGTYAYSSGGEQSVEIQPFRCDPIALVQEGLETHWTIDRILTDLTERMDQFPTPRKGFKRVATSLSVDAATQSLLAGLDGERTLGQALGSALNSPRALSAAWVLDATCVLSYAKSSKRDLESPQEFQADIEIAIDDRGEGESGDEARMLGGAPPSVHRSAASTRKGRRKATNDTRADTLREEIATRRSALGDVDHYELLAVDADAKVSTIKKAYFKAAKRYHPDALAQLGLDDLKPVAAEVFARIAEAFEVLSDDDKRHAPTTLRSAAMRRRSTRRSWPRQRPTTERARS